MAARVSNVTPGHSRVSKGKMRKIGNHPLSGVCLLLRLKNISSASKFPPISYGPEMSHMFAFRPIPGWESETTFMAETNPLPLKDTVSKEGEQNQGSVSREEVLGID